ncbi:30S ribosomal protein S2 [Candidatus Uhrbacteria bacterium CG10_big_fil_rev_8_21_14_0_10_48_11]|uniref:Small ribosomal subunit protein uS2 n=1 Tax=Candidatus Uhrbacteria bacterium CG10_big_fil_rev_8_21_14_0_10_48_11 TaxID=1975037 RepID=A0A2M8LDW0_9BACT|nr:MAG: 30S ribosomal protein S2 [Candidatus Uhrbacteria bacterium CG10_big_fil_rev_8_21_14_0_10_48_11]
MIEPTATSPVTTADKEKQANSSPSILEMLKAGVHFGHLTSKWHPKMRPFIFTARQGIHIINLEVTRQQMDKAMKFIEDIVVKGGNVLFVGTKKQIQNYVKSSAEAVAMPYVHDRWIGGMLTNFAVIGKMIARHKELGRMIEQKSFENMTKKERLEREREYNRLEGVIGGIAKLERMPEAIFLIDVRRERTAVGEANKVGVPIVAVCDTNTNPDLVQYPIAGNDDAVGSLKLMIDEAAAAVKRGTARRVSSPSVPPAATKASV